MHVGIVKDEIPVVRSLMRANMKCGNIKTASGHAAILADLEKLESDGIEKFIVFDNGRVEGIAS